MDRNKEATRRTISNGFNRRRHRTSSLRDSPDEDISLELHESVRLRDRVKKDRDRERDRGERDLRERDSRDRDLIERDSRERTNRIMTSSIISNKRRRNERLMNHRDDIDDTSEESVNDDEDEDDDNYNATTTTNHHHHHHLNNSSFSQIHHNNNPSNSNHNITSTNNNSHGYHVTSSNNHHLQQRKSFPLSNATSNHSKAFRAPPVWRPGDEVISVPVPRKARSASAKRSHDWVSSSGNNNVSGGGEQVNRQTSDSPARPGVVSPSNQAPMSPSSLANPSLKKKLKPSVNNNLVPKLKPPKTAVLKPSSANPEELEIEIAEVLYGLKTQSQVPSPSKKDEVVSRSNYDVKSRNTSPISNSTSSNFLVSGLKSGPLTAVAPKRKRPRQVPENLIFGDRRSLLTDKDADQTPKREIPSPGNLEKISASSGENGSETVGSSVISQVKVAQPPELTAQESSRFDSESKPSAADLRDDRNLLLAKEEIILSPKMKESSVVRTECIVSNEVSTSLPTQNLKASMVENRQKEEKFEIDLMAPPPQVRSSAEGEIDLGLRSTATDQKLRVMPITDVDLKPVMISKAEEDGLKKKDQLATEDEKKSKETKEDKEPLENNDVRKIDLQLDLEKPERDVSSSGNGGINALGNKLSQQPKMPVKASREDPVPEKPGHSTSSMPLPLSFPSWPGGLPPMGYMAPLQGVVSMDGTTVTPPPPPIQPLFSSQPGPKRCATHCNIAKNIYYHQQFMKMNPYWQATASASPLFGSKPGNLGVLPGSDLHSNVSMKGGSDAPDVKPHNVTSNNKGSSTSDSSQRKQQQVLIQQALPPGTPNNLLTPTFIFPLNQQQAALSVRPSSGKSPTTGPSTTTGSTSACPPSTAMNFNYPNMGVNETQYLAILQNNGYPFPIPAAPNFRGPSAQVMPMFNGSFYPSQMINPSQQNASNASNSTCSSQKHLRGQQHQRPQSGSTNNNGSGGSNLQNFASQKSQPSQSLPQPHNNNSDDSPSSDNRGSRNAAAVNLYGQNFLMPIHPQNFALMAQSAAFASGNSNQSEKKTNQPQGFAMSFGPPMNGSNPAPSIDMSSMVQNHVIFQNSQDAARQNMQMMSAQAAVAAQAAQKKNVQISEDVKSGKVDLSNTNDGERKGLVGKSQSGQSIAFTRSDLPDPMNNSVITARIQAQNQHILNQLKQQQQQTNRSFSQNLVQTNSNIPFQPQTPQWKGSGASPRSSTSQAQSSLASSTTTIKGHPQQNSRAQLPMHAQISFDGGNKKQSATSQGQALTSNSGQTPSSPMMASSPTTSSMSRGGTCGSPRTSVSASTNGKPNQGSVSGQQSKTSMSIPVQKPLSNLGSSHVGSSNGGGAKMQNQPHNTQHQQQPLITKNIQHGQLFFSNPFPQVQSSSNSSNPSGYYMHQPKKLDKNQTMSSSGILSLSPCPGTLSNNTTTNDPAKAIAAATNNAKNSGLPPQGAFNASQFAAQHGGTMLSGFSYVHSAKPATSRNNRLAMTICINGSLRRSERLNFSCRGNAWHEIGTKLSSFVKKPASPRC